jgi:beta-glucanase (GH16 family)
MTKGVYQGLDKPADELDTIEAYGVQDLSHPNQSGYWVASHTWNQGAGPFPTIYQNVNMTSLGGGANWSQTFHTYGTKITQTDTIYYCDNVEIGRHATTPLSKTDPFFFFINLAVGGNGWPMDLSRYNGTVDMYVDYVRVYK